MWLILAAKLMENKKLSKKLAFKQLGLENFSKVGLSGLVRKYAGRTKEVEQTW